MVRSGTGLQLVIQITGGDLRIDGVLSVRQGHFQPTGTDFSVDVIRCTSGELGDQTRCGYFQFSGLHIGQVEVCAAGVEFAGGTADVGFTGTEFNVQTIEVTVGYPASG